MSSDRVTLTEEDIDFAAGLYPALGPSVLISSARVRTWAEYVAEQYAAREQALREEIAGEIKALRCPGSPPMAVAEYAFGRAKEMAVDVARGGAR